MKTKFYTLIAFFILLSGCSSYEEFTKSADETIKESGEYISKGADSTVEYIKSIFK
jgi:PBP1b-binding outer membrane lipoprotein LpoB